MRCLKAPLCKGRCPEGGGGIEISLPYQGRWILPQAKDGEVFVSDGHILFVWPKRIWKEKSTKEGARKAPSLETPLGA